MELARRTLGKDVVVLGSRTVEPKGLWRFVMRPYVELFAAPPEVPLVEEPTAEDELSGHLIRMGLSAAATADVVARAPERSLDDPTAEAAVEALADFIRRRQATLDNARVICLVGPTGAGKTTTLAKLAARLALEDGQKVGLVTTDTYRIGAVHHLETYAEIMGLPSRVVEDPQGMEEALEGLAHCDRILIDTSGRNFRRQAARDELRSFVEAAAPEAVALVAPLTLGLEEMADLATQFGSAMAGGLILTKYDEVPRRAKVVDALRTFGLPLVAIANGQTVPDDIWFPTARMLAQSLQRGGRRHGS